MTAFIKTCQTFGSFVLQATEATHSTNHPQHPATTNFAALRRALDYDTLFSKSATSFFTQKPPPLSQTPHQPNSATKGYVSVSEPASIRGFSIGTQEASYKNFQTAGSMPASGATKPTGGGQTRGTQPGLTADEAGNFPGMTCPTAVRRPRSTSAIGQSRHTPYRSRCTKAGASTRRTFSRVFRAAPQPR